MSLIGHTHLDPGGLRDRGEGLPDGGVHTRWGCGEEAARAPCWAPSAPALNARKARASDRRARAFRPPHISLNASNTAARCSG